jgi:Uncharacterized protein conserved in bacteria
VTLVAFLRGVNVGGHKTFRPSLLARELSDFDVVNVGAAGTFVVRKPGSVAKFRAALAARLPFETAVVLRKAEDVLRLETDHPFGSRSPSADTVRFVSVALERSRMLPALPVVFPADGKWLVRVITCTNGFVFGEYRRDMKTVGYLGQMDKLFGGAVTTRNWNTVNSILRLLKAGA